MPQSAYQRFIDLLPAAYGRYLADVQAAFDAFGLALRGTISGVGVFDLLVFAANPLVGGALLYNEIVTGLLEAWTELQQDLALAPRRAILSVVDEVIPVPDILKTRVMRADEAIRWVVAALLEFSTDILDLDTPQWFDSFKDAGKIVKFKEFFADPNVDAGLQLARKNAVTILILMVTRMALSFLAWGVVVAAGFVVFKAHQPAEENELLARCMPQTSSRKRVTETHQTRRWET